MSHSIQGAASGVMRRSNMVGWVLATIVAAVMAAGAPGASAAEKDKDKDKAPTISHIIGKEMQAAQQALQKGQWQEAIKNLDAAEQKSPLTAFDKKTIYDFKGFANVKLNNLKAAEENFEKAIATGAYTPDEAAKTTRLLFRLSAGNQQYPKALEFGKQVVDSGAATPDDIGVMAQLYYLQKDCKNTAIWADKAVAAARKAGEAPKENLYQFKLQCASDAGDNAAMMAALVDLIKLTNKTNYWNTLLRLERQEERDDRNLLMIYRVMYDVNAMTTDSDYIEMAQLLGDAALPGEAAAVLDKAMASGLVKDEHKERTNRLLASLRARADSDKKGLPQFEAEAAKNPAGELSVKLGEVYYGAGDYQNAVAAIGRGLQKGQVKHPDEAYVYLGRAQAALKNLPEAKKAFGSLKSVPNVSPRVLRLWDLYAEKLGS